MVVVEPPSLHERLEEIQPTGVAIEAEAGRFRSWTGGWRSFSWRAFRLLAMARGRPGVQGVRSW